MSKFLIPSTQFGCTIQNQWIWTSNWIIVDLLWNILQRSISTRFGLIFPERLGVLGKRRLFWTFFLDFFGNFLWYFFSNFSFEKINFLQIFFDFSKISFFKRSFEFLFFCFCLKTNEIEKIEEIEGNPTRRRKLKETKKN